MPSDAVRPGRGRFCSASCRQLYNWRADEGAHVKGIVASLKTSGLWAGRAQQKHLGRWGGKAGAKAGREKGGRPSKATPAQQQEMLRFDGEGKSSREIAEEVFGDRRFYKRVQRFLAR